MLCGSKWKSCDCEWFNFEENDDLHGYHAQRVNPFNPHDGQDRRLDREPREPREPRTQGRPRARTYGEEVYRRRLQEQRDEELARRLQYDIMLDGEPSDDDEDDDDDDDDDNYDDSYIVGRGGVGGVPGLGIASGHHINEHYRHDSGQNRDSRTRLGLPPMATYNRRAEQQTPTRETFSRGYGSEVNVGRGARGGSMERRLAERLSEHRQGHRPPHSEVGYLPAAMSPHMGTMTGMPPPPPMGPYTPGRMPLGMGPSMSPPMMATPQHHPFGGFSPHGPPMIHHPPPHMADYAPVAGGSRGVRRHDYDGSAPRSSSMAGLNGPGSGMNRVFEWRNFVQPGVPGSDGRVSDERLSRVM